ncbi:MAG: hypothetical protein KDB92_00740, partial [Chitinophagaceae bacterium]|nr:hypothetical protein [Chitinophagaceae bacterium]
MIVCIAAAVVVNGCRKTDKLMQPPITGNNNNSVEEKFFNNHASTEPLVKALNGFLQRTNDTLHFVEKTVSRIGYPRWDKALSFAKLATAGKGNSADSTTITYIPFVRDSQNYVNATMIIQSSFSDTIFNYLCDWQYSRFGYDTTSNTWNAKDVFHLFSKFDYAVFDRIMFKITDPQLFGNPGNGRFPVVKIKQPEIDEKKANKVSNYVTVETCTIYDVCYGTPEEYQNHCGGYCTEDCDLYDHSEEICTILYEGTGGIGGDPGGGGGGGTGDGSGGDGGATGGGENGDGTPGDCNGNPTEGNRTAINNTCGPGWEP